MTGTAFNCVQVKASPSPLGSSCSVYPKTHTLIRVNPTPPNHPPLGFTLYAERIVVEKWFKSSEDKTQGTAVVPSRGRRTQVPTRTHYGPRDKEP